MNEIFEGFEFLDIFCFFYLDGILVYSKSFDEYLKYLKFVF